MKKNIKEIFAAIKGSLLESASELSNPLEAQTILINLVNTIMDDLMQNTVEAGITIEDCDRFGLDSNKTLLENIEQHTEGLDGYFRGQKPEFYGVTEAQCVDIGVDPDFSVAEIQEQNTEGYKALQNLIFGVDITQIQHKISGFGLY